MDNITTLPIRRSVRVPPARPLDGRVAVVTGSTRGVGLAVASALANAGAMIVLNGPGGEAEIHNLCCVIGARHDVAVRYDNADMTDDEAIASLAKRTASTFGPIDILINNVGCQRVRPCDIGRTTPWDTIIAANLSAMAHATQAVLPDMKRRRWGRIVSIASVEGLTGSAFKGACAATNRGVVRLTKMTALDAAEDGVTCNAVCSGHTWTPLVQHEVAALAAVHKPTSEEPVRDLFLAQHPNRKCATVSEIAAMVAFLCGPAGGSITGMAIPIDGGWTAVSRPAFTS